jgi:5-methyltetrahydrofolate--homocysteine methyltransferase
MKRAVAHLIPYLEAEKDASSRAKGRILLATVKGDVHDIGKNIVGVVLQCNNFEVIDLGVMVPAAKILETAKAEGADIIGLSGLITPSLDEMCHLAAELERNNFDVPLLIGGATTSRVHTAVKIDPNYQRGPVVHVNDASRAVGVASALLSPERRAGYATEVRDEYVKIATAHARAQADKRRLTLRQARDNGLKIDWTRSKPVKPSFIGVKSLDDYPLSELVDCIDWTPFFQTWELSGRYPAILDDPKQGEAARSLFADAQAMLKQIVDEKWFRARAAIGFWPANAIGDDIVVYGDDKRAKQIATFHTLRQQLEKREGRHNVGLSDFIAPKATDVADYIGAFVVTAGIGEDVIADRFKHANDDYSSILVKALADRLAEAFAERLHQRVRKEFWGYAPNEALGNHELILEKYQGIRPAPGYPAQPDHTEKAMLFRLLDAENSAGVKLTESFAMWPGSSVCGLYFSHEEAEYFGVGKIELDQVEDYATRKGWTIAETERWLAPILNYIPAANANKPQPMADDADLASHPIGCSCVAHLRLRRTARG